MSTLIDSYEESNGSASLTVVANAYAGQSFSNTTSTTLDSCKFYVSIPPATGNLSTKLYAHTGTFGSTGKPTGSALATSDNVDASTISSSLTLVTFTFSGANRITLDASTYYVIQVYNTSNQNLTVRADNSSSTHAGNLSYSNDDGANWSVLGTFDAIFYIYGATASLPSTLSSIQNALNTKAGTTGLSIQQAINSLAGTTNLTSQQAWNVYAGTTGLSCQQCANVKVGTTGLTYQQACNLL